MKLVFAAMLAAAVPLHAGLDESVKALASVGREGKGNDAASAAWREVVNVGTSAIPALLAAAGKGNPVADNWLRLAGDARGTDGAEEELGVVHVPSVLA